MVLYSEFGTVEEAPATTAVIAPDRSLFMVLGNAQRVEVVMRAPVVAVTGPDDWSVAAGPGRRPFPSCGAVVSSAVVVEIQQRASEDGDAGELDESGWRRCEGTLPVLFTPVLASDTVTWRGEVDLPVRERTAIGPTRRLRISEVDWYDGPTTLPPAGARPAPFVCHVPLA